MSPWKYAMTETPQIHPARSYATCLESLLVGSPGTLWLLPKGRRAPVHNQFIQLRLVVVSSIIQIYFNDYRLLYYVFNVVPDRLDGASATID